MPAGIISSSRYPVFSNSAISIASVVQEKMTNVCRENIRLYDEFLAKEGDDDGCRPCPYERYWEMHKEDENERLKKVLGPASEDRVFVKTTYQYSVTKLQKNNSDQQEENEIKQNPKAKADREDVDKLDTVEGNNKIDTLLQDFNDAEEERRQGNKDKENFYMKKTRTDWLLFLKVISIFPYYTYDNLPMYPLYSDMDKNLSAISRRISEILPQKLLLFANTKTSNVDI